uniref:Uncharacterized protein n=1 Tax=Zea mays TaxID=4577 RepID=A0A804P563_MAIZE
MSQSRPIHLDLKTAQELRVSSSLTTAPLRSKTLDGARSPEPRIRVPLPRRLCPLSPAPRWTSRGRAGPRIPPDRGPRRRTRNWTGEEEGRAAARQQWRGARGGWRSLDWEDGDSLKLQLPSAVTMSSDRTFSTSADDPASNHDYMTVLSVKAASVASQWLELLHQDIRGRLAGIILKPDVNVKVLYMHCTQCISFVFLEALKRSRKRVRNALHTELPYLTATEFSSNQENESSIANTSEIGCTDKAVSEAHVARWRSLFVQMDKTLQEEGKQLENKLKQVQEMQLNCDKGLKHMTCEAPLLGPMAELWKLKNPNISESEWAVQAAAASIYSTCNMVMRTENVPCF